LSDNDRRIARRRIGIRGSIAILAASAAILTLLALLIGRYPEPGFTAPGLLADDSLAMRILLRLRLPRIFAALLLGLNLGLSGAVFQMLLRNPLVEPGFLGVSQGAALGAALAILFFPAWGIHILPLIFAAGGLLLSFALARAIRFGGWIIRLVIAGLAVSAFMTAGIGLAKYVADPESQLQELTFWMLGGLSDTRWQTLAVPAAVSLISMTLLLIFRWRMNILSLDDVSGFSLGARPAAERMIFLLLASAGVAAMTSIAGIISWVGLLVPHLARRVAGADGRGLLPAAALIGGILVLASDTLARTLLVSEIPLGIITSLWGAGLFVLILTRKGAALS
jgi:iron complex transport system permease protein